MILSILRKNLNKINKRKITIEELKKIKSDKGEKKIYRIRKRTDKGKNKIKPKLKETQGDEMSNELINKIKCDI